MRNTALLANIYRNPRPLLILLISLVALPLFITRPAQSAKPEAITLFLAASLQPVFNKLLEVNSNFTVRLVPASSGMLARQIAFGAPSDIYITAHPKWSAWLDQKKVNVIAQQPLLSNRLALITNAATQKGEATLTNAQLAQNELTIDSTRRLLLGAQKIAVGDPTHVPVGSYAQQVFTALSLTTPAFSSRLVPLVNTRATVLHVERGEADLGIVYRSDALQSTQARLEGLLPTTLHARIRYDMLLLQERARALYDFLSSAGAQEVFIEAGFTPLTR